MSVCLSVPARKLTSLPSYPLITEPYGAKEWEKEKERWKKICSFDSHCVFFVFVFRFFELNNRAEIKLNKNPDFSLLFIAAVLFKLELWKWYTTPLSSFSNGNVRRNSNGEGKYINSSFSLYSLTEHFTVLEPQNPLIDGLWVYRVVKRSVGSSCF